MWKINISIEKKWEMRSVGDMQVYYVNEYNMFPLIPGFLLPVCITGIVPYGKRKGRSLGWERQFGGYESADLVLFLF